MYIFDIENKTSLKDILLEKLKVLGVRCRLPKKIKDNEKENVYSDHQIFQKPLHLLKKCCTYRLNGSALEVPEFLADACNVIEKEIKTEGIFRKGGSTCKQKERKLELNQGKKVTCEYHVLDACCLVKLFFRELPQPIIPFLYHDIFLKCLLLSTYEKELDALMLACLLMPEENLATLAYFMEFLLKVSWNADKNKMNIKNLAIILAPTLMPLDKGTRTSNNLEMSHHFKVIEMLIENAERIGKVPDQIVESLISVYNKKIKKKRRSGSITRMITGLKKIVSSKSSTVSDWDDSIVSTPDSFSSLGKRKNIDLGSEINLSAKKKRLFESSPPRTLTPLRCRMHGYASSLFSLSSPSDMKRACTKSPGSRAQQKHLGEQSANEKEPLGVRTSRLNLVRRCTTKKQKPQKTLGSASSMEILLSFESDNSLERKFSVKSWGRKKNSSTNLITNKSENYCQENSEKSVSLSADELITVPKSEYESIKNRVSALEEDLKLLNVVHSVQTVYEKTLEESERLNEGSTEQLAKRLSRELKIRRSSENKIIRSPSARKIGSIRRRSREAVQKSIESRSNLKRGRPNTVLTGLPSPRHRTRSENISSPKKNHVTRSLTFREPKEEWKSGDIFFEKDHILQKRIAVPQGRPSVAEIRCQNAGMVLEKAKLFNSLTESKETGINVFRRQSIRLENLRRMNDADQNLKKTLLRTQSLSSDKKLKASPLFIVENTVSPKTNHDFKEVIIEVCTPKSQKLHASRKETPSIKKSLVTRSPSNLAKTPLNKFRTTHRSRATPMKALIEAGDTPHIGLRRSPRILIRSTITPSRLKD